MSTLSASARICGTDVGHGGYQATWRGHVGRRIAREEEMYQVSASYAIAYTHLLQERRVPATEAFHTLLYRLVLKGDITERCAR